MIFDRYNFSDHPRIIAFFHGASIKRAVPIHVDPHATLTQTEASYTIPFDMYQTWMSDQVTELRHRNLQSFFDKNPKWRYHLYIDTKPEHSMNSYMFDDSNYDKTQFSQKEIEKIQCAYSMLINGASKSDLWRYVLIFDKGGVYTDFDVNFLQASPMTDIIKENDEFVSCFYPVPRTRKNEHNETIIHVLAQWWVAARKHHPIVKNAINLTVEGIFQIAKNSHNPNWRPHRPVHSMMPLENDPAVTNKIYTSDQLREKILKTKYYKDGERCDINLEPSKIVCITGPAVWKYSLEKALLDGINMQNIRIYNVKHFNGMLISELNHAVNVQDKIDVGMNLWTDLDKNAIIDENNQCWKQFI